MHAHAPPRGAGAAAPAKRGPFPIVRSRCHGPSAATPRPSRAVFRRRRALFVLSVGAAIGAVFGGSIGDLGRGVPASASSEVADHTHLADHTRVAERPRTESVVAHPGDTLWGIAAERHGTVDFDDYLDDLIDVNGGTALAAGQAVHLPRPPSAHTP